MALKYYIKHYLKGLILIMKKTSKSLVKELLTIYWFLKALWYNIGSSYWFLPAAMVSSAVILSFLMIYIDANIIKTGWIESLGWLYSNKPEGARALLSTVAGSMITVAGVVFSITIVALTLASSQYGPRLIVNFVRDRGNQFVLGTFISTFVYCLLLLRTIRADEESSFVPHLSVSFAVVLAILSISVLIYFIHHVAISIQATSIITSVSNDLEKSIRSLFPDKIGLGRHELREWWRSTGDVPESFEENCKEIHIVKSGYIRSINNDGLLSITTGADIILKLLYTPGDFVVKGEVILEAWPKDKITDKVITDLLECFILGSRRTNEQDVEFAIDQLVEVAVRALSPGINDPFTAINCIDRLSLALSELAERILPGELRYDKDNNLRVIAKNLTFSDLLDASFNQIRQYGRDSASVTIRLMECLLIIANHIHREEDKDAIICQAEMIRRGSIDGLPEENDRHDLDMRYHNLCEVLGKKIPSKL